MQLITNVGQIRVTVTTFPNHDNHWATEQRSNGWPVGQGWSRSQWAATRAAVWHASDVHKAATNLQRCIDDRVPHADLMLALDHYGEQCTDARLDAFLADHEAEEL